MTDYTDLIARLRAMPIRGGLHGITTASHAADLITALLAERDALIHDTERAQAALSDMATENERLRGELDRMEERYVEALAQSTDDFK